MVVYAEKINIIYLLRLKINLLKIYLKFVKNFNDLEIFIILKIVYDICLNVYN